MTKKAALHNLGCKVNAYETEAMQQILEDAGYEIVPFQEYADVYVINTCSVTNMADRKSRQMLHKAKKTNPNAIVIGAGCYVQTKEAQALLDDAIDIVIGNNKKHELLSLIEQYEKDHGMNHLVVDINHEKQEYEELYLEKTAEHTGHSSKCRMDVTSFVVTVSFRLREEESEAEKQRMLWLR